MGRAEARRERHVRTDEGHAQALSLRPRPAEPASSSPSFLSRFAGRCAAARLLAACLVLLLGAGAAQAQTAVKLVGNTGKLNYEDNFSVDYTQAFTTGSHDAGYTLTSVDLQMRLAGATNPSYTAVGIHADLSGLPGALIANGTLTAQSHPTSTKGAVQFVASGAGIYLAPETTYWVVFDLASSVGDDKLYFVNADAEDPGAATGWSIGNNSIWRGHSSTTWNNDIAFQADSLQIAINGYEKAGATANSGPGFQGASVTGNKLKVTYDEPLDEGSAPPGGSFRVTTTPEGGANGNGRRTASGTGPGNIGGTGTASVDGATVTVTLDRPVAPGQRVAVSYTPPPNNPVRDAEGEEAAAFSGRPAANVAPAPAVTGVAVVSDAGDDSTYALGETLRVRLTFGEKVAVDTAGGTPRVKIKMDPRWGEFWAGYESGTGTNALTFAYCQSALKFDPLLEWALGVGQLA